MEWKRSGSMGTNNAGSLNLEIGEDIYDLLNYDNQDLYYGINLFKKNDTSYLFDHIVYNLDLKDKDEQKDSCTSMYSW